MQVKHGNALKTLDKKVEMSDVCTVSRMDDSVCAEGLVCPVRGEGVTHSGLSSPMKHHKVFAQKNY